MSASALASRRVAVHSRVAAADGSIPKALACLINLTSGNFLVTPNDVRLAALTNEVKEFFLHFSSLFFFAVLVRVCPQGVGNCEANALVW